VSKDASVEIVNVKINIVFVLQLAISVQLNVCVKIVEIQILMKKVIVASRASQKIINLIYRGVLNLLIKIFNLTLLIISLEFIVILFIGHSKIVMLN
jgi:hypothetical protein